MATYGPYSEPTSFTFQGRTTRVEQYKEVLIKLCERIAQEQGDSFSRILTRQGKKHPYYSTRRREVGEPIQIPSTNIFAQTILSKGNIKSRCNAVLKLFGYPGDSLSIAILERGKDGATQTRNL